MEWLKRHITRPGGRLQAADYVVVRNSHQPGQRPVRVGVRMPRPGRGGRWRSGVSVSGIGVIDIVSEQPMEALAQLCLAVDLVHHALRLDTPPDELTEAVIRGAGEPSAGDPSWPLPAPAAGVQRVCGPSRRPGGWLVWMVGAGGVVCRSRGGDALAALYWLGPALERRLGHKPPDPPKWGAVVDQVFPCRERPEGSTVWMTASGTYLHRGVARVVSVSLGAPFRKDGAFACWAAAAPDRWGCFTGGSSRLAFCNALLALRVPFYPAYGWIGAGGTNLSGVLDALTYSVPALDDPESWRPTTPSPPSGAILKSFDSRRAPLELSTFLHQSGSWRGAAGAEPADLRLGSPRRFGSRYRCDAGVGKRWGAFEGRTPLAALREAAVALNRVLASAAWQTVDPLQHSALVAVCRTTEVWGAFERQGPPG